MIPMTREQWANAWAKADSYRAEHGLPKDLTEQECAELRRQSASEAGIRDWERHCRASEY